MSNISTYLEFIASKVYAKDVRTAIVNAISQCYDDVNAPALQTEAMQAAVQAKIDAGEMAALTIADGSITGVKLATGTITADKLANDVVPETDTTLTQPNVPADAYITGTRINSINADIEDIQDTAEDLADRVSVLEEDGGASDGVPTEIRSAILAIAKAGLYQDDVSEHVQALEAWASQVTDISVSPATVTLSGAGTSQLVAATTPAGGVVMWRSSDPSVCTVSATGLVTGVGNGSAIITARSGSYKATCAVSVSGFATLTGISAVYSGGTVTDEASLDDLREHLVVTASYDNGTQAVVTSYTLSGRLAVGTNTITVSYGGMTDSFVVTVRTVNLYSWDLTRSLTDKVSGQVAVASAADGVDAPQITAEGLVFNAATQRLLLGEIDLTGKIIEIDVRSMAFVGNASYHIRFLTTGKYSTNAVGPITYRANNGWTAYMSSSSSNNPAWKSAWMSVADGLTNADVFSGKTVKLVSKNDGTLELYLDGVLVGTQTNVGYGTYTQALAIGGAFTYDQTKGDQCYNMTISAIRIKEVTA